MDDMRVKVHGDAQVVPGLERIVRTLAEFPDPNSEDEDRWCGCAFCACPEHRPPDDAGPLGWHHPACPWRMAREWVLANPA